MPSCRLPVAISRAKIARTVQKLSRQIDLYARSNSISELCVICVLDAAFVFSADLIRAMKTPTTIVFLKARSYDGIRSGKLSLARLPKEVHGRPVLVVDTVYDTGRTIAKVLREVRKRSSTTALVILVEKAGKAEAPPVPSDVQTFVGIRLAGDPFMVGYGLDVSGRFRHLKDIRIYSAF